MSGKPDHPTHFLPVPLNHVWLPRILCVGAVEPPLFYDIPSLGWRGKWYFSKHRDTDSQG